MGLTSSKTFDPIRDLPDLTGKVGIVTGGNSGIGFGAVQHFARKGAKVYLAARNESKATGAIARLHAEGLGPGNGEVVWLKLDLSDPQAAKKAAEDFLAREKRLDILVNNAASGAAATMAIGQSGIQDIMIINHFSPFIFTQTLLPLLAQTAREPGTDVRIVNVSSNAHEQVPDTVHFRSKEEFNVSYQEARMPGLKRYGATKLANILWTKELQRRMDADGTPIMCVATHPGFVNTEGATGFVTSFTFGKIIWWLLTPFLLTQGQGAHTPVIAAASPIVRANPGVYKGAYLVPIGKVQSPSKTACSPELAAELWDSTESLLREICST